MKSKIKCIIIILCAWVVVPLLHAKETVDPVLWERAQKIHHDAIVIDTHCDTPMLMVEKNLDVGKRSKNDVDFVRMKEGGLDAIFFAVFVSNHKDKKHPARDALEMIDEIYNQADRYPHLVEIAFSPADIRRIEKTGKRAVLIGMENGGPIEGSLRLLRDFYRLGVRYITLTHNSHNDICDSSTGGKPRWDGLSPFGKEVVREMNRLGMLIDVSHISDKAFYDVLAVSQAPVFASHSCVRSLCNVPRNMSDDMIKALASKGGVIQINFFSAFLDEEYKRKAEAIRKKLAPQRQALREKYKDNSSAYWDALFALWDQHAPPAPGIEALIDHIDYVVKLVGVDYVGLGSDYDGASSYPQGLEDVTGFPLITYHLLKRGYKEEEIKKILGENFLRLFAQAEKVSKQLTSN